MNTARSLFTATTLGERVFAIGGFSNAGLFASPAIEFYSPRENTWSILEIDGFVPRSAHGVVVSNGELLIFGGEGCEGFIQNVVSINVDTKVSREIKFVETDEKPKTYCHTLTNNHGQDIIVFGGLGNTTVYNYCVAENKWSILQSLSENVIGALNYYVLSSEHEMISQSDVIMKIFLVFRPSVSSN